MINNPELIQVIKDRKLKAFRIGFTPTLRCNLECKMCYVRAPQLVDMNPEIPSRVLDFFNDVDYIDLNGAAAQLNPKGLMQINNAIKEHKTKFRALTFVDNGTFMNDEFFEILEETESLADKRKGPGVMIEISNDYWHDKGLRAKGIDKSQVFETFNLMKSKHPSFRIKLREYESKKEFPLVPIGRAAEFYKRKITPLRDEMMFSEPKENFYRLESFMTDANGFIIESVTDPNEAAKVNFGNIFDSSTAIEDALIKHGWGKVTFGEEERNIYEEIMKGQKQELEELIKGR